MPNRSPSWVVRLYKKKELEKIFSQMLKKELDINAPVTLFIDKENSDKGICITVDDQNFTDKNFDEVFNWGIDFLEENTIIDTFLEKLTGTSQCFAETITESMEGNFLVFVYIDFGYFQRQKLNQLRISS